MSAIDESLRELTYKERDGYPYIIHPLLDGVPRAHPDLLRDFAAWAAELDVLDEATVLLAPEAMGIPLAVALSLRTDLPYVVARKREYGLDGERMAYCETGYGTSCIYLNDLRPGDRVVLVDDVISTGGTAAAIAATLAEMDVELLGIVAAIAKGPGADEIGHRTGLDVHAMRHITFDDGTFTVSR